LKHLAITSEPLHLLPWSDPDQLIMDFKDLKLSHLEVNINMVRPSNESADFGQLGPRYCLPRSLTDILPASIEVVRLFIIEFDFRAFDRLFGKISSERHLVPSLRKILLRLPSDFEPWFFYPRENGPEEYHNLNVWRKPLNTIGIDLEVEKLTRPARLSAKCVEDWDN
jgi:hypothetical protein